MRTISQAFALACLLVFACPARSRAQDHALGVKAGLNAATQKTSGDAGAPALHTSTGFVAGAFYRLPLFSRVDVQAEGLYSVKGAKLEFSGINSTLIVDYLDVPVVARYRMGGGRRHYYVAGGPYVASRLRARARTQFSGSTEDVDVADEIEKIDFGAAAGGGVEIGPLVFDARYTHGLKNVDKRASGGSKTMNRAIAVTAGVRF